MGRADDDVGELCQQCYDECGSLDVEVIEQLRVGQDTVLLQVSPRSDDHPGRHQLWATSAVIRTQGFDPNAIRADCRNNVGALRGQGGDLVAWLNRCVNPLQEIILQLDGARRLSVSSHNCRTRQ